jgi:hypothetical protein
MGEDLFLQLVSLFAEKARRRVRSAPKSTNVVAASRPPLAIITASLGGHSQLTNDRTTRKG